MLTFAKVVEVDKELLESISSYLMTRANNLSKQNFLQLVYFIESKQKITRKENISFSVKCLYLYLKGFCWSAKAGVSICMSAQENVANEFVFASPAIFRISCSSSLDDLWDGR